MRMTIAIFSLLLLAGCTTAGTGPTAFGVSQSIDGRYPVMELTDVLLPSIQPADTVGLSTLGGSRFNQGLMRAGDQIEVRVFDKTEEGLMSATDSKQLDLGRYRIDDSGYVSMPYVGRMKAAGTTPASLQDRIVAKLKGSTVAPQASVMVVEQGGRGFTVSGAVNQAQRYQLSGQSERVLDAIAMAGGPSGPPGEMSVTLLRGSSRATAPMERLIAEPSQNVRVQPNDQIFVRRDAISFTSFGSFRSPGEFNFQPGELTMAQAIARSGGLDGSRADPGKVYLLRREQADIARRAGMLPPNDPRTGQIPVAYLVDLRKTQSLFVMQALKMRDGDMLYVPSTAGADFGRAFQIFEQAPPTAAAPQPGSPGL